MKRLALAMMFVATAAFAQEIGTEITPVGPTSGGNQQQTTQTQTDQQQTQTQTPPNKKNGKQAKAAPAAFDGTRVSASAGSFGIRAGFGASGSTGLPTGTGAGAASGVAAPTVGISYMASDNFKLVADLGFGLGVIGAGVFFAAGVNLGFDYLFRDPGASLRPFIHVSANFNLAGANAVNVGFGAQLGGGAEYFLSPEFSLNGRLLLAVPMTVFGSGLALGIFTVTPGIGATWYF